MCKQEKRDVMRLSTQNIFQYGCTRTHQITMKCGERTKALTHKCSADTLSEEVRYKEIDWVTLQNEHGRTHETCTASYRANQDTAQLRTGFVQISACRRFNFSDDFRIPLSSPKKMSAIAQDWDIVRRCGTWIQTFNHSPSALLPGKMFTTNDNFEWPPRSLQTAGNEWVHTSWYHELVCRVL